MEPRGVVRAAIVVVLTCVGFPVLASPADLAEKVHPLVLEQTAEGPTEFILFLKDQADLSFASTIPTKQARGSAVHARLREVAQESQAPLIELLEQLDVAYRPFWIANMIWVRGDADVLALLAQRPDVERIDANPTVSLDEPVATSGADEPQPTALEWGLLMVMVDQAWALGYDGEGVVIGGQDTGYAWNHPALIDRYRGWDGSQPSHAYNWHDAVHSGGGICGADSPEPCDDHSHGTHTMGTMVGDDGGSNQVGMAPGARWIGCRNMDQGNGTPATYTECFEWFVAPTDLDGLNPDPSKAPHVINNSWACPESEGCSHDTLKTVVENTRAAGIVVVASAGNSGSGCSSVSSPPAIYEAAFSVGATNSSDGIAGFSSRGPVTVDGSNRLKPDVSAPGVSVRSSVPGGGYAFFSGTSMAGPHVAGLVALLLDARPDLIGNVGEIEELIRLSSAPKTSGQDCGGMPGSEVPNPVFGHGRIDALQMLVADSDGDGVDNLTDCMPTEPGVWDRPGPASDLLVTQNSLGTALSWSAPAASGGTSLRYDVLRSLEADDFSQATCLAWDTDATMAFEPLEPAAIFHYLVRAKNACGGNLGETSYGSTREGGSCP